MTAYLEPVLYFLGNLLDSAADSLNTFLVDDTACFLDLTMGNFTTDLNQVFAPRKIRGYLRFREVEEMPSLSPWLR